MFQNKKWLWRLVAVTRSFDDDNKFFQKYMYVSKDFLLIFSGHCHDVIYFLIMATLHLNTFSFRPSEGQWFLFYLSHFIPEENAQCAQTYNTIHPRRTSVSGHQITNGKRTDRQESAICETWTENKSLQEEMCSVHCMGLKLRLSFKTLKNLLIFLPQLKFLFEIVG